MRHTVWRHSPYGFWKPQCANYIRLHKPDDLLLTEPKQLHPHMEREHTSSFKILPNASPQIKHKTTAYISPPECQWHSQNSGVDCVESLAPSIEANSKKLMESTTCRGPSVTAAPRTLASTTVVGWMDRWMDDRGRLFANLIRISVDRTWWWWWWWR